VLIQVDGNADEGQPPQENADEGKAVDSDEEGELKIPPKNFTELDRLAYVVRSIENDCAVAPVGAFKLTPTHELRYNDSFRGIPLAEA
jgi:radial spoke head protein 9